MAHVIDLAAYRARLRVTGESRVEADAAFSRAFGVHSPITWAEIRAELRRAYGCDLLALDLEPENGPVT